ncbi:putative bifunctional diguanylate cyclase/phosphodiesterase [Cryptosporangium phraense]|uniref:Bifunctional diguanylate cyclase/phosphodiesterase n=1 Tax=Cryptosporangium phraense TaxID=2593070 RepID=A0A545AIE7_9ACTN|nr:bifunctional diguanylate cyclase/phosphodiesterase [Cryptosporangium phraense]TQS41089.1 bifunctional diguanylate cyclase/phosphodiesterase [Cryptosporangium phraense]
MRALRGVHLVLVAGLIVLACAPALETRLPDGTSDAVPLGAYVTTALLLALRAVRTREWAWGWAALGLSCFIGGSITSGILTADGSTLPFPSAADIGWLGGYPFVGLSIVGFLRVRSAGGVALLDGAVAGVGAAALFSTVVVDLLAARGGAGGPGTTFASAIALAYPLADALLAGVLICQFALGTWRGRRDLIAFTAGIATLTIADTGYVRYGAYEPGTWVDVGYGLAVALVGVASWLPSGPSASGPATSGDEASGDRASGDRASGDRASGKQASGDRTTAGRVGLAGFCATGALVVLLAAARVHLSLPSVTLAGVTLVLVLIRFLVAHRELRAIGTTRYSEARRDPLTGLANRRGFTEFFDDPGHRTVAGLLLDLDRFKQVNDSFGHQAGDELLRRAAGRLREVVAGTDLLARLGGDEFVIVRTAEGTEPGALAGLAERIRGTLSRPFDVEGVPIEIDVSIGIAAGDGLTADALLRHADIAMYCAKRAGGGHAFYRERDDEAARVHLQLAQDLRRDVAGPAMVLHYQPKLDLHTDAVGAVEALVRWQHPVDGLLYPDTFLPIVDETGLMTTLTRNVLTQAMDQCAAWRRAGLKLSVAVNVSADDLESNGFTDLVIGTLRERGLPADALTLEITETTAMENSEPAHRTVRELHHVGIKVSIDDYGTDHSTLAHLHRLLVAGELKLDRRFVMHLETEERSSVIVRSSIQLAHALGMAVVAEGVENAGALAMLRDWGCDTAQGYFISRPQTAENITEWLVASRGYGTTRSSSAPTPAPSPAPPPSRR